METVKNHKEYYITFKNKHKDKINTPVECDCGGKYTYFTKTKHFTTKRHCYYVEHGTRKTKLTGYERIKRYREKKKANQAVDCV